MTDPLLAFVCLVLAVAALAAVAEWQQRRARERWMQAIEKEQWQRWAKSEQARREAQMDTRGTRREGARAGSERI